jgi:Putative amidoligase enzyme (DUF2126)
MKNSLFYLIIFFYLQTHSQQYIDLKLTLFGIEYSFQDELIVQEPGRNTSFTPYKKDKLEQMLANYMSIVGIPKTSIQPKLGLDKPGYYIETPADGNYVINMEPVTIEFNTTPKTLDEIVGAATPIYEAARLSGLKPYVNPAAERSGMGHFHVGGKTLNQSPFYIHENLLRNTIAFFHKHPALLYGFAEAYDIGPFSNIETLHEPDKQAALEEIFKSYDEWFQKKATFDVRNGFLFLIDLFKSSRHKIKWAREKNSYGWFAHYRFINLENLIYLGIDSDPNKSGKLTVEFRMFRPPPTPEHARSLALLLIKVFDYLAKPNHLEHFEIIDPKEMNSRMSATRVASDWEELKLDLNISDANLDAMIAEYVDTMHAKKIVNKYPVRGVEIFETYSEKIVKGNRFEIRVDSKIWIDYPNLEFNGTKIVFFKAKVENQSYWVGVIDLTKTGIEVKAFRAHVFNFIKSVPLKDRCFSLFAAV